MTQDCSPPSLNYLEGKDKDELVFPYAHKSLSSMFIALKKRLGLGFFRLYDLRHAKATRLAVMGMGEPLLKQQMGWAPDSSMFKTYVHIDTQHVISWYKEHKERSTPLKEDTEASHTNLLQKFFTPNFRFISNPHITA